MTDSGKTDALADLPIPTDGRARLEGDVAVEGDALRFPPRAAALVVELARPAGDYRLELSVDPSAGMRLEVAAGGRPVPVPLASEGTSLVAHFGLDQPLDSLRLMPVEDGRVVLRRLDLAPRIAGPSLLPPWRIGAVRVPLTGADTPVITAGPTPPGWQGCRIVARQGVEVEGHTLRVGPGGTLLLALDAPRAGWWRCEAELSDETGAPVLVEPRIASQPRAPLDGAILRPVDPWLHCADFEVKDDGAVVFRPRSERGEVTVRRLHLRPLPPAERLTRVARPLRRRIAAEAGRILAAAPRPRRSRGPVAPPDASVSIVVATRDAAGHLRRFLASLAETAPAAELVLVDNGSRNPEALRLLDGAATAGAKVIRDDRPFNFAALANLGARASTGEALVFANNDIVFADPGWLAALLAPLADEETGVTGARLLYPDGRVQHGGVVLAGEARVRHAERFLPWWRPGYERRQRMTVPATAVTGALLATRRAVFDAVGGFDAARYGVLYNDVDFCLRVARQGLGVLYVPAAEAVHAESVTIGVSQSADPFRRGGAVWRMMRAVEADNFRVDWAALADRDPCYPQAFDPVEAAFRPLSKGKPWQTSSTR